MHDPKKRWVRGTVTNSKSERIPDGIEYVIMNYKYTVVYPGGPDKGPYFLVKTWTGQYFMCAGIP